MAKGGAKVLGYARARYTSANFVKNSKVWVFANARNLAEFRVLGEGGSHDGRMSPHVSTVFKELFDELKSMKQQQWTITNYGVLILAAIYWVKLPEVPHSQ